MEEDLREFFEQIAEQWFSIGNNLSDSGQLERAIKAYQEGLKSYPKYSPILYNLSCVYEQTGDFENALNFLNQYLEDYQEKCAMYKKSILLKKLNLSNDAESVFLAAEKIEGSLDKFGISERKKAAELLDIKINALPVKDSDMKNVVPLNLYTISDEELSDILLSFIKENYPSYDRLSISFIIHTFFENKGIYFFDLPIELKNKINKIQTDIEQKLQWDLVPEKIKSHSSEEIAAELVEFIKNNLAVKGRVWVKNYSRLFWDSQNINKWQYPTEIQIKLTKSEGIAQEIFDNEQSKSKKTDVRSRKRSY